MKKITDTRDRLSDALTLARTLPDDLPAPEITEQDGDVMLEWSPRRSAVIAVWMREGYTSWAGILDDNSSHGRCWEFGKIPEQCLEFIRAVVAELR